MKNELKKILRNTLLVPFIVGKVNLLYTFTLLDHPRLSGWQASGQRTFLILGLNSHESVSGRQNWTVGSMISYLIIRREIVFILSSITKSWCRTCSPVAEINTGVRKCRFYGVSSVIRIRSIWARTIWGLPLDQWQRVDDSLKQRKVLIGREHLYHQSWRTRITFYEDKQWMQWESVLKGFFRK